MVKRADLIAEQQERHGSEQSSKEPRRNPAAHLVNWQWRKGQSGNPGGRPKNDFAADFARKVLEAQGDEKLLSRYAEGFAAQLCKGNAYTFKELAERGYGKLKEHKEVTHLYADESDEELDKQIAELERKLGLADQIDDASRLGLAQAGTSKANGKAKT